MYLAKLRIEGFRKLSALDIDCRPGLNVFVGPNNVGKTAVVDALRALLSTTDEGFLRVDEDDLHLDTAGSRATAITFRYTFRGLTEDEEADFLPALKAVETLPSTPVVYEACFVVRYSSADASGKLRPKRWCGEHEDNLVTSDMLEDLRAVYLPPLRNPASGLKPSRGSQLARLAMRLSDETSRNDVVEAMKQFDSELATKSPVSKTQDVVSTSHEAMLGSALIQDLKIGLTSSDFQRIAARLSLAVENLEIEQNGLGYNNLIYMAVVLSELAMEHGVPYKALIVEEPEAHLHPQLQAVLLQYLQSQGTAVSSSTIQVFVTSHSPNFASIAEIDSIGCFHQGPVGIKAFFPRAVAFEKAKKEKLQRYLDVTRAELFFAKRIILVEGSAELFMVAVLARQLGIDLRRQSVTVLSTEGLNFDAFLPLFGENALNVRVAVVSDGDPSDAYPRVGDAPALSAAAKSIKAQANSFIGAFFALKTFEYDLALDASNRILMLAALEDLHPTIAKELAELVAAAPDEDQAKTLFAGMFEREKGANVRKGAFGQALAQTVTTKAAPIVVPPYIRSALEFIVKD